eukprot:2562186-Rhodomonas_salina.1
MVRWYLSNAEAKASGLSVQEHWMHIKSQAGQNLAVTASLEGLPVPGSAAAANRRRSGDSASSASTSGGERHGLQLLDTNDDWTMDDYMEAWGDAMNKTAVCRNCDEKGKHSAPFCSKPRREDLPC